IDGSVAEPVWHSSEPCHYRSQANDRDLFNARWDYNLNPSNTFFFRYSKQNADLSDPNFNPNITQVSQFDVANYGGTWTHIFSPSTTLEAGFGFNHPDGGGGVAEKPVTRAEYLDRTGIRMYPR